MAKLVIAPSAEADLNAIVDYIAFTLHNPEAALSLVDEVAESYDRIESLPSAFPFCDDPVLRERGYHQVGVNGYIMVYRIEDAADIVRVIHFYHATQDYIRKLFPDMA